MKTVTSCVGIAVALAIASCSTPYQPKGFRGGYSDTRLTKDQFLVSFRGNGYTSRETVEAYLLYRCAEVAVENGFDYFVVTGGGVGSSTVNIQTPGQYNSTTTYQGYGTYGSATSRGTYTPGQTIPVTRHGGTVNIRVFTKADKPDDPSVFDAHELMQYLGPRISR